MSQLSGHCPLSSVMFQLAVLCFFRCILLTSGSVLNLQTSPDVVIGGLTKSVTLNCSLSDSAVSASIVGKREVTQTPDNMSTLSSLVITKNGHDVAMVSSVSPAHVTDGSTNVQVSGSVSGNSGGSGFIQLTITQPTVDQTGEFVCQASGLSAAGHGLTLTSTVEITNSEASIADLVAYVTDLNAKIGSLETKNVHLQQEVNDVKSENAGLKQTVNGLKNKTELMVYFNARINGNPHYSSGQVVVFGDVEERKGNNYNSGNGIFTCTIPGYYHFTLGCLSMPDKVVHLALYHNSQDVFRVYGDRSGFSGNGNAATLQLSSGDEVKIKGHYEDSTIDGQYCSFHGYLIQAL